MRRLFILFFAALLAGCNSDPSVGPQVRTAAPVPEPITLPGPDDPAPEVDRRAYAAIVVDARNRRVLFEENAESPRYPASLTKMMTLYLLFAELDAGRLTPASPLVVSKNAQRQPPTKIGVKAGETITVDTAARALAVRSANDVAMVVAENLAGSQEDFALRMTRQARALGMRQTTFVNPSGLPDPQQVSSARDMAILGKALSDRFPQWFAYFSTESFEFNGRTFRSTNKLLGKVDGVDGIKTGYIRDSGFNLVVSVRRDGKHIIAVVIGGRSGSSRNKQMEELIETYLPEASGGSVLSMF